MNVKLEKSVGITGTSIGLSVFEMIELKKVVDKVLTTADANYDVSIQQIDEHNTAAHKLAIFVNKLCFNVDSMVQDLDSLFEPIKFD